MFLLYFKNWLCNRVLDFSILALGADISVSLSTFHISSPPHTSIFGILSCFLLRILSAGSITHLTAHAPCTHLFQISKQMAPVGHVAHTPGGLHAALLGGLGGRLVSGRHRCQLLTCAPSSLFHLPFIVPSSYPPSQPPTQPDCPVTLSFHSVPQTSRI